MIGHEIENILYSILYTRKQIKKFFKWYLGIYQNDI